MTNRTTGETSYITCDTRENAKAYFDKWYAKSWKIDIVIEGNSIKL